MGGSSVSTYSKEVNTHINLHTGEHMNSTTCSEGDTDRNTNSREVETNPDTNPNHQTEDLRDSMSHSTDDTSPLDEALVHYAETTPWENGRAPYQWERVGDYTKELNYNKLALKEWRDAGIGLFATERVRRNTTIGELTDHKSYTETTKIHATMVKTHI